MQPAPTKTAKLALTQRQQAVAAARLSFGVSGGRNSVHESETKVVHRTLADVLRDNQKTQPQITSRSGASLAALAVRSLQRKG